MFCESRLVQHKFASEMQESDLTDTSGRLQFMNQKGL